MTTTLQRTAYTFQDCEHSDLGYCPAILSELDEDDDEELDDDDDDDSDYEGDDDDEELDDDDYDHATPEL
jgi:hypothetical protein